MDPCLQGRQDEMRKLRLKGLKNTAVCDMMDGNSPMQSPEVVDFTISRLRMCSDASQSFNMAILLCGYCCERRCERTKSSIWRSYLTSIALAKVCRGMLSWPQWQYICLVRSFAISHAPAVIVVITMMKTICLGSEQCPPCNKCCDWSEQIACELAMTRRGMLMLLRLRKKTHRHAQAYIRRISCRGARESHSAASASRGESRVNVCDDAWRQRSLDSLFVSLGK